MKLLVSLAIILSTVWIARAADAPLPQISNQPVGITLSADEYVKIMNLLNSMPRGLVENLAVFLESKEFQAQAAASAPPRTKAP